MSTPDVPGYNPKNNDKLSKGNWAEHEDGSLIYVTDITPKGKVIFELIDLKNRNNPLKYTHAKDLRDFQKSFSYNPKSSDIDQIKWTWHDKSPFPWEVVMKQLTNPTPLLPDVMDEPNAATKVAQSLQCRLVETLTEKDALEMGGLTKKEGPSTARSIFQRLRDAMNAFST